MTIIIILFLLLMQGCGSLIAFPPPQDPYPPVEIPTRVIYPSPTYTPTPAPDIRVSPTPSPTLNLDVPTYTPTPLADSNRPCQIIVRQPPPDSPTRMPMRSSLSTPAPGGVPMDVHVAYCVSDDDIRVGDEWHIHVRVIDMGLPVYQAVITNVETQELLARYNPAVPSDFAYESDLDSLTLLSMTTYNQWEAVFTFVANKPDVIQISLYASGEVHFGYPGPATWTTTPYEVFRITIQE